MQTSRKNTLSLVEDLKQQDQDFEWYPTTDRIINIVREDIKSSYRKHSSLLDIGAGDGRVLKKLQKIDEESETLFTSLYAIEKSEPLITAMDNDIIIVGTDFFEQQLIDKEIDAIFCNPPYSDYKNWMQKIIRETNAEKNYFVVPERWENEKSITSLIEKRDMKYNVIGKYDFVDAERAARAKVDIVKIETARYGKSDPFDLFVEEQFDNFQHDNRDIETEKDKKEEINNQVVQGKNLIETLNEMYLADMGNLHKNFNAIRELDPEIFRSLDINLTNVKTALRSKIKNCKNFYWRELFTHLNTINKKLCSKQRDRMLSKLSQHNTLDFTKQNAYAVVIWAIKNANKYYDEQLIDMYKTLLDPDNVKNYKSNKVMTGEKEYRYSRWGYRDNVQNVCLKLDYRLVHQSYDNFGANDRFDWDMENGMKRRSIEFIEDIFTVAENLGFDIIDSPRRCQQWEAGKQIQFDMRYNGEVVEFAKIRAYKNGNIHFMFNQTFLRKWNIEAGRLLGWLKDPKHASEETGDDKAQEFWGGNYKLQKQTLLENMNKG